MKFRYYGSAEWFTAPASLKDRETVARFAARLHGAVSNARYVNDKGNYLTVKDYRSAKRAVCIEVR